MEDHSKMCVCGKQVHVRAHDEGMSGHLRSAAFFQVLIAHQGASTLNSCGTRTQTTESTSMGTLLQT